MALLLLLCDLVDQTSQFLGVLDQPYSCPPLICVSVNLKSYLIVALLLLLCDIVDQTSQFLGMLDQPYSVQCKRVNLKLVCR